MTFCFVPIQAHKQTNSHIMTNWHESDNCYWL